VAGQFTGGAWGTLESPAWEQGRLLRYAAGVALPPATRPEAKGALAGRLRDIEAVADAALSRLDEQSLLAALLERVKNVLHADTPAVTIWAFP